MGEGKFVPLDAAMGDLEKLKKLREEKDTQARESASADLGVAADKPEPRSLGAAAKDFTKKKGAKKAPPVPAKTKTAKVEKPEVVKTEAEMAKELESIKTREDLLVYLRGLSGSIKINGRPYSFQEHILPKAEKILNREIPVAAMQVDSLGIKIGKIIGEEQETQFRAMQAQMRESEEAIIKEIGEGVHAKLKNPRSIYISNRYIDESKNRKLSKEQQAIIKGLLKDANDRISEAMKAYREKAEQDKQAPREEFVKEHGDKFKTNLFDAEGNWVNIQECLKDGRVKIVTGQKADSKGTTSYVPIVKAIELLGQYTIVQEKSAPETKPEDSRAVAPDKSELEKDLEKKAQLVWNKMESQFSEFFNWEKIEDEINKRNQYPSQKTREKLKANLFQIRKDAITGAEVREWIANGYSEDEVDRLIIESFSTANDEINSGKGYKNFHKLVSEICAASLKPAEVIEAEKEASAAEPIPTPEPAPAAKPAPAASPAGEKYLGEEIPEEKKPVKMHEFLDYSARYPEKTETDPTMYEVDSEGALRQAEIIDIQEKLAQLKIEVAQARKEYVEADYKKNKARKRLGRFFKNLFDEVARGGTYNKSWEADKDVAQYQYFYESKLFEYKNLCLENAKKNGVLGKELGTVLKELSVEDNVELADAHNQVKIEQHEGTARTFLADKMKKSVEWYNKLPRYQKLLMGVAFGLASVATAGGAAAGYVALGVGGRKMFLGMVTGAGVAAGLESGTRKNMEKEERKREKEFASQLEGKNEEEVYNLIKNKLGDINSKQELKLNRTKNKNLRNLAAGIGVGTFIGSGIASHLINGGWHKISEFWQNHPGGIVEGTGVTDTLADNAKTGVSGAEQAGAAGFGAHAEAPVGPAIENPIELEVEKGSSLEGTLIKHLKDSGMSAEEAGSKAHILADQYAEENGLEEGPYSLVQPGTQIELSPDGSKIISINSDHELGYLPEEEISAENTMETGPRPGAVDATDDVDIAESEVQAEAKDIPPSATEGGGRFFSENDPEAKIPRGIEIPVNGTGEYAMDPETITGITEMESALNKIDGQLEELDDKILKVSSGQYESVQIWPNPETMLDELREQKQALEHAKANLIAGIYSGHVGSLRKLIYGGIDENWKKIGPMPAAELLDHKNSLGYKFFARVMDSHSPNVVELQRHISPLRGEKVDQWIIRIGKIMKTSGIRKI